MDSAGVLIQYLSSEETYSMTKDIKLRVLYGDKQHIKTVLQTLAKLISNEEEQPIVRLLALRFNKELVETFHEEYIHLMQKIVLPKLELIAQKNIKFSNAEVGKYFFLGGQRPSQSNNELQMLGDQFYRVLLECIWIWSKWFPLDKHNHRLSNYRVAMERLCSLGLKFQKIQYFDFDLVIRNIPQSLPPLPMIVQLREYLKVQENFTTKQICSNLLLNPALRDFQTKYHTYGELLNVVVRRGVLTRQKKLTMSTLILQEEKQHRREIQEMLAQDNPQARMSALLLEKQQLDQMNQKLQQRNNELQKQLIVTQNENVLLSKEIEIRDNTIYRLTIEFNNLSRKLDLILEQYEKQMKSTFTTVQSAQFQHDLIQYKQQLEYQQLQLDNVKLKMDLTQLESRFEELKNQWDVLEKEKEQLQYTCDALHQEKNNFEKKKILRRASTKNSQQLLERSDSLETLYKLNSTKSQLVQQEQLIIQLKAQLSLLKEQISKFDKKNSATSTQSCNTILINNRKSISTALANSQSKVQKQILAPTIEYDASAFTLKFRQACLQSKAILYSDDTLQIGVHTTLKLKSLTIVLTIQNKTCELIEQLSVQLSEPQSKNLQAFRFGNDSSVSLREKESHLIKIQLQLVSVPFQLMEATVTFKVKKESQKADLCLPCTINKFFQFQPLPPQLPNAYFYTSRQFQTALQNQAAQLLPDYKVVMQSENELELLAKVQIDKVEFVISIYFKKSIMQIRLAGDYHDRIAEAVISSYQGLFLKR